MKTDWEVSFNWDGQTTQQIKYQVTAIQLDALREAEEIAERNAVGFHSDDLKIRDAIRARRQELEKGKT